jgi:hypothetical protein
VGATPPWEAHVGVLFPFTMRLPVAREFDEAVTSVTRGLPVQPRSSASSG